MYVFVMNAPEKIGTQTRRRILIAAKACFAEHGFLGASTRQIAEAAGVAQGLLRYHFETKEALWKAVMDDIFAHITEQYPLDDQQLDLTARQKVEDFITGFIDFFDQEPALYALMTNESRSPSKRQKWLLETHVRAYFEANQAIFEEGQREGVVRATDPVMLYYAIIGIVGAAYSYAPEIDTLRPGHSIQDREKLQSLIADLVFI